MAKNRYILLRVGAREKDLIADAACRVGKSMSTFILDAMIPIAREAGGPARESVVSFFERHLDTAKAGGGNTPDDEEAEPRPGYRVLGERVIGHLACRPEWKDKLDDLEPLLADVAKGKSDRAARAWFKKYLPDCWEQVPSRRRGDFIAGVAGSFKRSRKVYRLRPK